MRTEADWVTGDCHEEAKADCFCSNCGQGLHKVLDNQWKIYYGEIVCNECYRKLRTEIKDYDTYCDCCGKGIFTDDDDSYEHYGKDTLCADCYEKIKPIIEKQIEILGGNLK